MLFVKECRAAQNARFCSGGYAMMSKKNRTRQQMEEEMSQLRKVFMTVRLMKADEVQGGKKGSAPCYAQWRRSRPCENCVARQALEKNTRKTRLEYFGQELYEITASCVQVDGQLCVLELTRKIDRSVLLDPENGERLLNSITDEREKRYRDPLTGAYNRTYYDENYRYRSITAGVAMLDMDDLKFSAPAKLSGDNYITSKIKNISMINAQDIKIGTCIRMDGKLYFCIDFLHVKPGKGNTFMRVKLKDVVNGYVLERRFNIGEKLEDVRVERRPYQFLYKEGEDYIFMNQETFDQHPIAHDLINGVDFLLEGAVLEVVSDASTETVLYADMPIKVQMKITYTEPGVKGDTATNTLKPATVESGATVRVPLFINEGETIEIDTRDGSYVSRVKA